MSCTFSATPVTKKIAAPRWEMGNLMCAKNSSPSSKRFLLTDPVVNSLGFSKFRGFGFAECFNYADYATPTDAV
jgi:hypothetical protein